MTTTNIGAAREAARATTGQFGEQQHSEPEAILHTYAVSPETDIAIIQAGVRLRDAEDQYHRGCAKGVAEIVLAQFPTAARVRLMTRDSTRGFWGDVVVDADGIELCEVDDLGNDELDTLLASFEQDLVEQRNPWFVTGARDAEIILAEASKIQL